MYKWKKKKFFFDTVRPDTVAPNVSRRAQKDLIVPDTIMKVIAAEAKWTLSLTQL